MTAHTETEVDARTDEAAAWLTEFMRCAEDGGLRVATREQGEWQEWPRGIRLHDPEVARAGASPEERLRALAEALVLESDTGVDLFASPYLHSGPRRVGEAVARRHAHADVDGRVDLDAVRSLGAMAVASGSLTPSGEPHGHVYLRLDAEVSPAAHAALCTALGAVVGSDCADTSKVGDADVLRPAGTLNYKGTEPRAVRWLVRPDDPGVRSWSPEALADRLGVVLPPPTAEGTGDEAVSAPETSAPAPAEGTVDRAPGGALRARLDGLARAVTEAPAHEGNGRLNWAAGKAGAAWSRAEGPPDAAEVREGLVAAFLARPVPLGETVRSRRAEAERTVRSGWEWGRDHPEAADRDGDDGTDDEDEMTVTDDETGVDQAEEARGFWESRPLLSAVRDFARARRVSPWAMLGAVLARAVASVPPSSVLPPTRGSAASLNLFVAICGASGSGKSATMEAAREFLDVRGGVDYLETAPGSGEGLLGAYAYTKHDKGQPPKQIQTRASVLLDVDEVGALGALAGRTASTLLPFLKTAWSGKTLATQNAEVSRQRRVEGHRYRLAIVAGVQPVNARVILDDAAGGFPQRWLWLPTYDAGLLGRDDEAAEPVPWVWRVPAPGVTVDAEGSIEFRRQAEMVLPAEAREAILSAAEAQNRPIGAPSPSDGLNGHALLTRAKVAALLALLDERGEVVESEDWHLAGVVMAESDRTRESIVGVNAAETQAEADRRATRQGRSSAIAAESEREERTVRALGKIRERLRDGEEHPEGSLKNAMRHYRGEFAEAVDRLVESGEVERSERANARRRTTVYLRLVGGGAP